MRVCQFRHDGTQHSGGPGGRRRNNSSVILTKLFTPHKHEELR
ncbi:MAG TPA: hypothetical protein VND65_23030 [Candidatus Binatia bacterium]|nr:hypothetical protein [Candidatus Binatia bacterium]